MSAFEDSAWLEFRDLSSINIIGVSTGMLDGQGEASYGRSGCHNAGGKCKNYPITLKIAKFSGGTINNIALVNSKGFHMNFLMINDILVQDLNIIAPNKSPNTDGIHISQSTNINITSSTISVGDDCISIGPGSNNIFISKIICGPGHRISSSMACENVVLANIDLKYILPDGPATSTCTNVKGISIAGMENPQPCS
ncbi:hypothetical protein IFM89_008047 [Coptis chinensis]|uniref:Polygalacturonase n=1 Tax=Coptis chinensis TaxID=261450 RepID=A0A835HWK4_9MAGN|nr:hypothetical protein IFM89_008047 [Coptis chinensis]